MFIFGQEMVWINQFEKGKANEAGDRWKKNNKSETLGDIYREARRGLTTIANFSVVKIDVAFVCSFSRWRNGLRMNTCVLRNVTPYNSRKKFIFRFTEQSFKKYCSVFRKYWIFCECVIQALSQRKVANFSWLLSVLIARTVED